VHAPPGPLARFTARVAIRGLLALHWALVRIAGRLVRRRPAPQRARVLLTGTFHSDAWIAAHLGPLAASPFCAEVIMVATSAVPAIPKVTAVHPPRWLSRSAGKVGARLATFVWLAVRLRPDTVGGFHLLINGLVAQLAARVSGARSLYFCVGGPTEFAGGGYAGENAYFARLGTADDRVERMLLRAALGFDDIVTMGTGAAKYFRDREPGTRVHTIGGAIDPRQFYPSEDPPEYDVVFVGRLVPIKRVDRLIGAIALAAETLTGLRAVIVGDGPLRGELEALAEARGIRGNITFAGRRDDVAAWLRKSRVFVLTSASEGVALSLMEAMMCRLPAVVPDVGDLRDVVDDGINGFVVGTPSERAFADAIVKVLENPERYRRFRDAALARSSSYTPQQVATLWRLPLVGSAVTPEGSSTAQEPV
jgi:glycosyltransferase involved in cell wall biosynthesis